jgi:hypothetical protein
MMWVIWWILTLGNGVFFLGNFLLGEGFATIPNGIALIVLLLCPPED